MRETLSLATAAFKTRRWLRWVPFIGLLGALVVAPQWLAIVSSPSLPRGVYRRMPADPLQVGGLYTFCPPPKVASLLVGKGWIYPGACPGGSIPFGKRLVAVGPYVCATKQGLQVNERVYPWGSQVLPFRLRTCGKTDRGCLIFLGDSTDSVDSRYFGCVAEEAVVSRIVPLLTE